MPNDCEENEEDWDLPADSNSSIKAEPGGLQVETKRSLALRTKAKTSGRPLSNINNFHPLIILEDMDALRLCTSFVNGHMTLDTLYNEAKTASILATIRQELMKQLEFRTWAETAKAYPALTHVDNLLQWLDSFKVIPKRKKRGGGGQLNYNYFIRNSNNQTRKLNLLHRL